MQVTINSVNTVMQTYIPCGGWQSIQKQKQVNWKEAN